MKKSFYLLTAMFALAASSFAGVAVQSPAAGSTVGSPVHFVASATSTSPVTAMRIYVDNVSVYLTSTAKINASVAMSAATHNVVIQAWDSKGTVYKQALVLKVGTAAPGPTPTPAPPTAGLPTPPANAVTISNIEQMPAWDSCTVCAGIGASGPVATYSMAANQASPSLDGHSTKFNISGATPYSDVLWWKQLGAQNTATNLKYDVYFYLTAPQAAQALEFDMNQAIGSQRFIFGTQCNIKTAGAGHWDVWGNASGNWLTTGVACSAPTAFVWHHLTWEFKRTANQVIYVGFTYDGVTHYVNRTYPSEPSSVHELNVAFQMDGDSKMDSFSTWLNKVSVMYW
ncbi:MAG TPA: hypothetical protein VGN44_09850 [Candidatus Angelobacter sp.]